MEKWKNIPGYSDYKASSSGRICSLSRKTSYYFSEGVTKVKRKHQGRILKQLLHNGYYTVKINGRHRIAVHRLVALAFHKNPFDKRTVNHINTIKTDNRAVNLEWATDSENILHGFKNGKFNNVLKANSKRFRGSLNPKAKLNIEIVNKIRSEYQKSKTTQKNLASKYGISQANISSIVRDKTWTTTE